MSFKGYCYSFSFLLFLFAGATPGVSQASATSYDISRDYICGSCTDRQSTLQFVREYVIPKQCQNDSRGPGPGGGLRPRLSGRQSQVGEQSPAGFRTCSGPDERAIIMNPETNQVRVFIVQRRTQARDGMPPLAYPRSGLLSRAERSDRFGTMELYREYIEMRDAVNDSLAQWMRNKTHANGAPAASTSLASERYCNEYTALATLGDLERMDEVQDQVRERVRNEFESRFEQDVDIIVSDGWAELSGGPVSVGVRANVERAGDSPEVARSAYFFAEAGNGSAEFLGNNPDYLYFEFKIRRSLRSRDLAIDLKLNQALSKIHGEVGFLSSPGVTQDPSNLDQCSRQHLSEAFRTHVLPGRHPGSGGYSGGLYRLRIGSGATWTTWVCGSGTCCELGGSTCLPEGEVREF